MFSQVVPKCLSVYPFRSYVRSTSDIADVIDSEYVRMIQGRSSLCLADKAQYPVRIGSVSAAENLYGCFAIETCVFGQVDLTHAAFPDFGDDLVLGEYSARDEAAIIWIRHQ